MAEKSFLEIQGTFLVKIRDNTSNGIIGETAFKHIDNFLKVVGPLKIKGLSQDRFRLSIFPISLVGAASERFKKDCIGLVTTWEDLVEKFVQKFYQLSDNNEEMETNEDDDHNDTTDIFKIEGNLFDFETSLYNGDHKWYDELTDGKLKEEALMHKAIFEESWEDAAPGVMKFWAWLKSSFENFYELDYDVLVKLEECWWKNWKGLYLDINRISGNAQDNKKKHHDPSICNIRRFEMMKYSLDADDEYVAIKEHEHYEHSRTNIDACQAYRELFRIMDEG
ncbi:hypothetical protein Tco_1341401 [Tanacetum coccineum]